MSNYKRNKLKARFFNTEPSATDQSQANDTDVNVIVKRYAITGTAPGAAHEPMYEDFTSIPGNLRDMIEQTRSVAKLRRTLPAPLREMPVDELLALKPEDIQRILKPADKPADKPKEQTT